MSNFSQILALIDGSMYATSVCDHAAWVSSRCDAHIDMMHVVGRRGVGAELSDLSGNIGLGARTSLLQELADHDRQNAKLALKRGRLLLDAAQEHLQQAGIENAATRMRNGEIVESVEKSEKSSDLVIIGKRGEGADFDKLHPGSNLERVARFCKKPLLVTARAFRPIQRVLVAYDDGQSTRNAVDSIATNPLFAGLDIKLISVGSASSKLQARLDSAAANLTQAGLTTTTEIIDGQPEVAIVDELQKNNHDLLVLGSHGHSRIRRLILGSTTTTMIASCKTSVLMYR